MADANFLFLLTHKEPETQTLGGLVIGNFAVRRIFEELEPFFHFFTMADTNFPFPSTQEGPETQTLGGSVIGNFAVPRVFAELEAFFQFFLMADRNFLFVSKTDCIVMLYGVYLVLEYFWQSWMWC